MADIQGNLPIGLAVIKKRFEDAASLTIIDRTNAKDSIIKEGWEYLPVLQKEGNYEQVKQRLANALEHTRRTGGISDVCYEQANGRVSKGIPGGVRVDRLYGGRTRKNEHGSGVPGRNRE